jgi:hypothetical protein
MVKVHEDRKGELVLKRIFLLRICMNQGNFLEKTIVTLYDCHGSTLCTSTANCAITLFLDKTKSEQAYNLVKGTKVILLFALYYAGKCHIRVYYLCYHAFGSVGVPRF